MLVVFKRFETKQGELESVLAISGFGVAGSGIATGFGQNGHHVIDHANWTARKLRLCGDANFF
jgi:thiamine biosynthesis lipoprotein ApbE